LLPELKSAFLCLSSNIANALTDRACMVLDINQIAVVLSSKVGDGRSHPALLVENCDDASIAGAYQPLEERHFNRRQ
jgi:hypothetical protein